MYLCTQILKIIKKKMKTTIKLVLVITFAAFCSNVSAQNIKLAHINMQELIESMPDYEEAMESLQKHGETLSNEIEEIQVELNRLIDEFQRVQESLQDLVRQSRLEEIQRRSERLEQFQQQAQFSFQQEQNRLLQPILEKANKAVETVAKEQNITYVISADQNILLFKAVGTLDLLPSVKEHLGIRD